MQNLLLWWNTSSSKRFLFSVSCTFRSTSLAANSWGAEEGRTIDGIFILDAVIEHRAEMHRDGEDTTLPSLLNPLLSGQHCPLLNMLWLSNACILTVWDCFCLLYVPLHYSTPTCCTLNHRLCSERNKHYFVLDEMSHCFLFFLSFINRDII